MTTSDVAKYTDDDSDLKNRRSHNVSTIFFTGSDVMCFLRQRGIDMSYSTWCVAYVLWGYYGVEPPFGVLGAGYNLAWEIMIAVYACLERDLPPESRFTSRWVVLVVQVLTDVVMLLGLYITGNEQFVFAVLRRASLWSLGFMLALLLFSSYSKAIWFAFKYSGYPVELIYTSLCFYEWAIGSEQPPIIMMLVVFSMLPAVLRTIQRPALGKLWVRFSEIMLYSHLAMFITMVLDVLPLAAAPLRTQ